MESFGDLNLNYIDMAEDMRDSDIQHLFDDQESQLIEESMTHLSNVDYSLNSPLIPDEVEDFLKWNNDLSTGKRWNLNKFQRMKTLFNEDLNQVPLDCLKNFPKWFGQFNLKTFYNPEPKFVKLYKEAYDLSLKTKPIVDSFLKGWINQVPNTKTLEYTKLTTEANKWGSYYWELHCLVLLLNCTNKHEAEALTESIKRVNYLGYNGGHTFKIRLSNFGHVTVGYGCALFKDLNLLLDRNTVLMMKDTYVARFNTLIAVQFRTDNMFPDQSCKLLIEMYRLGDNILKEGGIKGYDSIKLLEPMCTDRLSHLAQEYRPLIPLFPDFTEHINQLIKERSKETPSIILLRRLINTTENVELVLTMYGSFRHWGHPFINYLEGLEALYNQVTLKKLINKKYTGFLASDLALLVIRDQFRTKKQWPVDETLVSDTHMLKTFIANKTWPDNATIKNFGNKWHTLPLIKCFEIPDVIDPSQIYSDKSHSITRSELRKLLSKGNVSHIPSKKVLSSLLSEPSTEWPKFLKKVNDCGIDEDHLIIGLKAKERELKTIGRFFALMSWQIRDYFVMTEYLIKEHFVPLFKGLTMADDLTTVMSKMIESSAGQGGIDYENITIANHIDYEKWNNHQRKESTDPVFKVMGQFLGYPQLITRTHEIFEKSWIYYNNRGDLMMIDGSGNLVNKTKHRVCWQGQEGGLEGLRQKGWSINNFLVIQRESYSVNTRVKVLAQGDNQVICSQYKLQNHRNQSELINHIQEVVRNNDILFKRIVKGTSKLGLIINQDETVQSADFLNYGKTCVFRGNIRNLETKRWSRVTCVTNDQLPTLSNTLSTVSSNALTVAHYSLSPINSMYHYNFIGHFARLIVEFHNPALRRSMYTYSKKFPKSAFKTLGYLIASLYLDPSIGGICGMSLTRFVVRSFPDPVTEGLTFLKLIFEHTTDMTIKQIIVKMGNPQIAKKKQTDITKLLEDPLSLNIPRGIDANTMIKNEIKKSLLKSRNKIKNNIIKHAVDHQVRFESAFLNHLITISPLFPRFLSEYRAATYFGITDSLIGLFQNSKTIRNQFRGNLTIRYDKIIIESELTNINQLVKFGQLKAYTPKIWDCSPSHADLLRFQSWGQTVHGATIPHPVEFFSCCCEAQNKCRLCKPLFPDSLYISILIPVSLKTVWENRGTCSPYLGSSTVESTSILQSWERETKMPVIRRAAKLRNVIGWFVESNSNLATSIINNIHSLTGEDWSGSTSGFRRTGSALHRFNCSRQSSGGYPAQNPTVLARMIATTDTLADLGDQNYDFMFQNCILSCLMNASLVHPTGKDQGYYHSHIKCNKCLRPIEEIQLNCPAPYNPPDVSQILQDWKPSESPWSIQNPIINIPHGNWDILSHSEKSYHIGVIQGFIFGDSSWGYSTAADDPSLFPLTIRDKVEPETYLRGLLHGILRSGLISVTHLRLLPRANSYHSHILGHASITIDRLSKNNNMINIWRSSNFVHTFSQIPHQIPSSYPMVTIEAGSMGHTYLQHLLNVWGRSFLVNEHDGFEKHLWIFADVNKPLYIGLLALSEAVYSTLNTSRLTKIDKLKLIEYRKVSSNMRDVSTFTLDCIQVISPLLNPLLTTDREVRHSIKFSVKPVVTPSTRYVPALSEWKSMSLPCAKFYFVDYEVEKQLHPTFDCNIRYQNPLISGLRLAQLATGSFYKIICILEGIEISPKDILCGGDGSGGISALMLRRYPFSRLIYNSLCDYNQVILKGSSPSPPSAINQIIPDSNRCINLETSWCNPNDLSDTATWDYFLNLKREYGLNINLMLFDMEITDFNVIRRIERSLNNYLDKIGSIDQTIIFKTYLTYLFNSTENILTLIGPKFAEVRICYTPLTSSQSSEVYIVFQGLLRLKNYHHKYLNWGSLMKKTRKFPLFRTEYQEFLRALELKKHNLLFGIPRLFIPEINDDLCKLFDTLGVRSDISYRISKFCGYWDSSNLCWAYLMIVTNYIISYTIQYVERPNIPSDGTIINLASWITGFTIWLGYATGVFEITRIGQLFVTYYFPFYFNPRETISTNKKGQNVSQWVTEWGTINQTPEFKHLQLDNKMAILGRVIRVLTRSLGSHIVTGNIGDINAICHIINPGITYNSFMSCTSYETLIHSNLKDSFFLTSTRKITNVLTPQVENEHFWKS
ncbi:RNA-dependent RNA polymerase [Ceratitis capitata sigmavirus]|uniref:RNA-directed RNA polymerase L n=2 Tax=root TaxID=1 RepID=W8ASG3_CERCA|nr:RNA-dependent RNA polymerase [Ceratitis capitata sigmavirus]AMK09271.1 RNA-dependent RNA polymerase [Ceratitis capitata sigmavirus]